MTAAVYFMTHEDRLRGIVRAFRKAQNDPNVVIPATLSLLIEAAALALSDQDARYADQMANTAPLRRRDGNGDMSVAGTALKAGS